MKASHPYVFMICLFWAVNKMHPNLRTHMTRSKSRTHS